MNAVGETAFNFELPQTGAGLRRFPQQEKYAVFGARAEGRAPLGFPILYESGGLYAEGAFGIVAERGVRPACRSQGIGCRSRQVFSEKSSAGRGCKPLHPDFPPSPPFCRAKTLQAAQRVTDGDRTSGESRALTVCFKALRKSR
ncbi:hypothetical protein [Methylomonas sp. MgM2]